MSCTYENIHIYNSKYKLDITPNVCIQWSVKLSRTVPFMLDVVTTNEQFFIPYRGICAFIPKPYIYQCLICNGCILSPNQSMPLRSILSCYVKGPLPWFIVVIHDF